MGRFAQRAWLAWGSVGLLVLLCGGLAVLQYQWIGEITGAERTRLRDALQARLTAMSRNFNEEISRALQGLMPGTDETQQMGAQSAYEAQYLRWRETHDNVARRIGLAVPDEASVQLRLLDLRTGKFAAAEWPAEWTAVRDRMAQRLRGGPGGPAMGGAPWLLEFPNFGGGPPDGPRRERHWLLLELNPEYVRASLLPELLSRYLGEAGKLDYHVEVVDNADPSLLIYDTTPDHQHPIGGHSDASVGLLQIWPMPPGGRGGRGPGRLGRGRMDPRFEAKRMEFGRMDPGRPPDGGEGRWTLQVQHRAGSLEVLVEQTRRRNLAISGAILLLILATAGALVRFSRRAQRLADLEMNFVTSVSHELRTPLTVIRTAAFNLRGKLASRPDQVEKYGALIQAESEKLTALVEQVLQFASTKAGHAIRAREPVNLSTLIEQGLRANRAAFEAPRIVLEKHLDPDLPVVLADELALRHALQNLVDNALKYGTENENWIGIYARAVQDDSGPAVEIRVADRGPGIPPEEQDHIFDPFFRGKRAVQDQVHGTGLGLNLVKKIVEAHGGSIRVKSEPMKGTEFIVRIPAAPSERQDEFAHSVD